MIEYTIPAQSIKLIKTFSASLRSLGAVAGASIEDVLLTIRNLVQEETPVGETGDLKKGWSSISQVDGGFSFENRVPYAYVVEEGRYRGEGARTIRTEDGVFSRQAPEGMTAPVLQDDAVLNKSILFVLNQVMAALEK